MWEPPPWRSNAPRPTETHRNNVLDNSDFKKTSQKTKKSVTISRPNTAAGSRYTRPQSAAPRSRSQSRSVQVKVKFSKFSRNIFAATNRRCCLRNELSNDQPICNGVEFFAKHSRRSSHSSSAELDESNKVRHGSTWLREQV